MLTDGGVIRQVKNILLVSSCPRVLAEGIVVARGISFPRVRPG